MPSQGPQLQSTSLLPGQGASPTAHPPAPRLPHTACSLNGGVEEERSFPLNTPDLLRGRLGRQNPLDYESRKDKRLSGLEKPPSPH